MAKKTIEWDHEMTLRLIDLYKTKECFRRQSKNYYFKTKRHAAFMDISEVMGISTEQLKLRMASLKQHYFKEKRAIASKRKTKSKWYAFNNLQFLDDVHEILEEDKNPALSLKLIDLYKANECLWRPSQQPDIKAKRAAAWNEISKVLNLPVKELKSEISSLKESYLEEKHEIESKRKTESTWYAFDSLQFLDEVKEMEVEWNPTLSLKLVDLYRTKECFRPRSKECLRRQPKKYNSRAKKEAAWKEISEVMGISTEQLKSRIDSLKQCYSLEKFAIKNKLKTESKWYAFNSFQALYERQEEVIEEEKRNPAFILKLINLYMEHECLWRYSRCKSQEKPERAAAWNEISNVLNVPEEELKSEIRALKKSYLEEKQEIESKRKTESTWFAFDSLSFLDGFLSKPLSARIDVDWNSLLTLKFIDLYKERKCLWHPVMRNQSKQEEAWNEISTIMGISVEQLKLKMRSIKNLYLKEKIKIKNNRKKSKWYAFDSVSFLDKDRQQESESEEAEPSTSLRVIKGCDSTDNTNDVEETVIKEEYPEIPVENVKEEPSLDDSSHIEQNLDKENTSPKKNLNELSIGNRWDKKSTLRFLELMSQNKCRLRSTNYIEKKKAWQEMSDVLGLSIKEVRAKRQSCYALYRNEQRYLERKLRIRPKWYGFKLMSSYYKNNCNEMNCEKEDQFRDDESVQNFGNEDDQTWEEDTICSSDNEGDQSCEEDPPRPILSIDVDQFHEEGSIRPVDNAKIMNVCRSCLSDMDSLIDMNSTIADGEITLDKVFNQLTGVEIVKGISSKICLDCKNQLEGFVKFRKRAQSSQETLIGWSVGLQNVVTIKEEHDTESIFDKYSIDNNLNPVVCIERLNDPFLTNYKQESEKSSSIDEANSCTEENQTEIKYIENTPSSSDCFGIPIIENQTTNDSTIVEKDNIGEGQCDNMEWEEVESTSEQEDLPPINYPNHWLEALKQSPIIFPCASCNIVFKNSELLEKHNCFIQGLCPICGKYVLHMEDHMYSHGDERSFKCHLCEKSYKQMSSLGVHVRTHEEKKIQCPDCDKKFHRKINLRLHQKSHKNIRDYECTQCNRRFVRLNQRTQHIKERHQGFRHPCTFCPKDFSSRRNLIRHLRIHTKETPYNCCECSKAFGALEYLKYHARTRHPDEYSTVCNPDNYKTKKDNNPIINKT